ncbi:hypothetical protein MBLNU230_g2979t1 [Neophaeotheca triangularis]
MAKPKGKSSNRKTATDIKRDVKKQRKSARLQAREDVEGQAEDDSLLDEGGMDEHQLPQFKDDSDAFNVPVEDGKDFISKIPSEILDRILSYSVRDHHPDLGEKIKARHNDHGTEFKEHPHVLLSLAAMSHHLKDHVESFCERQLRGNPGVYTRFAQVQDPLIIRKPKTVLRRSARVEQMATPQAPVYRRIFVLWIACYCLRCNRLVGNRATVANTVGICRSPCESEEFPGGLIGLSDAKTYYDLNAYMLLKSRSPGPRAKHSNLPVIPYNTVWGGLGIFNGYGVKYNFLRSDVERIANLVHGDVEEHMKEKTRKNDARKEQKRIKVKRELKIRYHTAKRDSAVPGKKRRHQKRIDFYAREDYSGESYTLTEPCSSCGERHDEDDYSSFGYESDVSGFGDYDDVHQRLYCDEDCACGDYFERRYRKYEENVLKRQRESLATREAKNDA